MSLIPMYLLNGGLDNGLATIYNEFMRDFVYVH